MADQVKEIEEQEEKSESMKELESEIKGVIKDDGLLDEEEEDKTPEDDEEDEEDEDNDESEEEEEDEKDSIPNSLKERAVKANLSLDEINEFPNAAMLEKYVDRFEKVGVAGKSKEGGTSKDDDSDAFAKALDEIFDFKEEEREDGEVWDPELVEKFGKMKELFAGLKKSNDDQGRTIEELRSSGYSGDGFLNNKITELGKPFEDLFGKDGSVSDEQLKSRDRVSKYVAMITEEAKESGESITKEEAFKRAINGLYGDRVVKEKGKKVSKNAKERAKRAINAPRGSDGTFLKNGEMEPTDPEDKAVKALEEKYG